MNVSKEQYLHDPGFFLDLSKRTNVYIWKHGEMVASMGPEYPKDDDNNYPEPVVVDMHRKENQMDITKADFLKNRDLYLDLSMLEVITIRDQGHIVGSAICGHLDVIYPKDADLADLDADEDMYLCGHLDDHEGLGEAEAEVDVMADAQWEYDRIMEDLFGDNE